MLIRKISYFSLTFFLVGAWLVVDARASIHIIQSPSQNARAKEARIDDFEKRVSGIERSMKEYQLSYLSNLEKIREDEKRMSELNDELVKNEKIITLYKESLRRKLRGVILNQLEESDDVLQIVRKRELTKSLKTEIKAIKISLQRMSELKQRIKTVDANIMQLKSAERELSELIVKVKTDYENRHVYKKRVVFETKLKNPNELTKNEIAKIILPLDDYTEIQKENKGLTIKFAKDQPLKAVSDGQIIYVGNLSNFGNVIMIDHGMGITSVILGEVETSLKKNQVIKMGEVIGKAYQRSGNGVYLELRKNNVVMNTLGWLKKIKTNL